jgi:quercetin dioxygenase-like cupin family protein
MLEATPWEKLINDKITPLITRQMVSGEDGTLGRLLLKRGAIVPRHSHRSEQYSVIISGALKFTFDDQEVTVRAGEVLLIPAHLPHLVEALEDTVDIDFFAPRRDDWIAGTDSYLRSAPEKR